MSQPPSQKPPKESPPNLRALISTRIVYEVPGMDQVDTQKDLVYKRVDGEELKMDVYSPPPASSTSPLPAVLFIHGGPLSRDFPVLPKEWGVFVSYGQLAAASGFVGVTFNHRFFGPQHLLEAQSDIEAALQYIRDHADTLRVDQDRIAIWAFSGGGPFLSHFLRTPLPYIRCIVAFYTLMDLRSSRSQTPSEISDQTLSDFSPVLALASRQASFPPIFIGRAGLDNPGLNSTLDHFVAESLKLNILIDVKNHPQGHHGFDIRNADDRSREIIRHAIEFIKAHL